MLASSARSSAMKQQRFGVYGAAARWWTRRESLITTGVLSERLADGSDPSHGAPVRDHARKGQGLRRDPALFFWSCEVAAFKALPLPERRPWSALGCEPINGE